FPVAIAKHRFEHNPDTRRQPRNFPDALLFERRQRIKKTFATLTGVEFPQRFEFVAHSVVVISSEVDISLAALSKNIQRFLDSARNDKGSLQFLELGLDLVEIGQLPGVVV